MKLISDAKLHVKLSLDVYQACLSHVLSTEKEEVMGLLIGDKNQDVAGKEIVDIIALRILQRLDKRKDRVEISPFQSTEGLEYAEKLGEHLGRKSLRVVGWYHSHPKITIWPSEVDLRTQFSYQILDSNFVGLIFSVFDTDVRSKKSNFEVICFQSEEKEVGVLMKKEIPISIFRNSDRELADIVKRETIRLSDVLFQEELDGQIKEPLDDHSTDWVTQLRSRCAMQTTASNIWNLVTTPLLNQMNQEADFLDTDMDIMKQRIEDLKKQIQQTES